MFPVLAAVGLWELKWQNLKFGKKRLKSTQNTLWGWGWSSLSLKHPVGRMKRLDMDKWSTFPRKKNNGSVQAQGLCHSVPPQVHGRWVPLTTAQLIHHRCKYSSLNPTGIFFFFSLHIHFSAMPRRAFSVFNNFFSSANQCVFCSHGVGVTSVFNDSKCTGLCVRKKPYKFGKKVQSSPTSTLFSKKSSVRKWGSGKEGQNQISKVLPHPSIPRWEQ